MSGSFTSPDVESAFIGIYLEWYLYGIYSGIFAMYLKCQLNKSRNLKITVVFYALCLLYILSTVTVICDLLVVTLEHEDDTLSLPLNSLSDSRIYLHPLAIVQTVASGCCDFIAQCIMIYRCWIVWGQDIRFVVVPSLMAIAYIATWLGSDSQLPNSINFPSNDALWTSMDKWLEGSIGVNFFQLEGASGRPVVDPLLITSLGLSMAVNALITALIVLKILKVFLEVKPASVGRDLGETGSTKLRHIVFIIVESGMALFTVQLVRFVLSCLPLNTSTILAFNLTIGVNQMFNGIAPTIILVRTSMRSSVDDDESFKETPETLCFYNPPSDFEYT